MQTPYYVIYASTAAKAFTEDDLVDLLSECRKTNVTLGITGLLLYSPGQGTEAGTFVQVLEGPRAEVQALYVKITRDKRHVDCTLLKEGPLFQPRFGEWTMGFRDLSKVKPTDLPGFNPIFLMPWSLQKVLRETDPVLQLLYSFAGE